jgi:cyanophycin synthetase
VAVLETARGGILREGLAFDWCTVGVVTNVSPDHLGLKGISTLDELARVKQVVVENVRKDGAAVLNAEDPLVAEMAAATDARIVYFTTDPHHPVHDAHIAQGGSCVYVENGAIMLAKDGQRDELVPLKRVPFTLGGKVRFQVQNALAATAAAWAAGLNPAMIVRALTTFVTDDATVLGRFNVSEIDGIQVVLDYGHNTAALTALGQAVQALGSRRTVMVLALPGDRRDEDLRTSVRATLEYADEYVFYDSMDLRGRAPEEVPTLMQRCLRPGTRSSLAPTMHDALAYGWGRVRPGDRLVFIADEVDGVPEMLRAVTARSFEDAACDAPIARDAAEHATFVR